MILLEDLVPELLLRLPDAPAELAERMLLRSFRELCRRANVWREELTIDLASSTDNLYPLQPSAGEVVDIIYGELKDVGPLQPATAPQLFREDPQWRTRGGTPKYYMRLGQESIQFFPRSTTGTVYLTVSLAPTLNDSQIDDNVATEWDEVIMDGALSKLLSMPNQPWTDGAAAAYHFQRFESTIDSAQSRARDQRQTGVRRVVKYGGY